MNDMRAFLEGEDQWRVKKTDVEADKRVEIERI